MKKLFSSIIFLILTILLIIKVNDIILPKIYNRYYMLEKELEKTDELFDVHVYGSCHAYTSFNPIYLEENFQKSAYVFANPGEIIPVTYLRMIERFKIDVPKVAFVEIWGINPYDTYDSTENILGSYLISNLERIPFSKEKLEVIKEYDLNPLELNFAIARYKDRILDNSLTIVDFEYSFDKLKGRTADNFFWEMESRLSHNGFKVNRPRPIENYLNERKKFEDGYLKIEEDIVKYLKKIIELCEKHNVRLIFYRAPYESNENELNKLKHFKEIVDFYDVEYIDLEEEIKYNFEKDFIDSTHLAERGANKSTEYLANYMLNNE